MMALNKPNTDLYEALYSGCGLVNLDDWTVVTLTGDDRHTFLHNMCTNEIKKLEPGQGCEAFCTDVKGKIVAHVFVLLTVDSTYLITVPDQAEKLIGHLDRYIIREDVELADQTESKAVTLVAGNKTESMLAAVLDDPARVPSDHWSNVIAEANGQELLLARFPLPGVTAFLVIGGIETPLPSGERLGEGQNPVPSPPSSNPSQQGRGTSDSNLLQKILQLTIADQTALTKAAWDSFRIEAGLPLYGIDFTGEHLPQEVARNEQAINFNKGCYLGQETIARLDALGHVNKQLVTVKFPADSQPVPGISLSYEEKQVGVATSVAWSPVLGAPIGIAMVRRGANKVGTLLDSDVGPVEVAPTAVRN